MTVDAYLVGTQSGGSVAYESSRGDALRCAVLVSSERMMHTTLTSHSQWDVKLG